MSRSSQSPVRVAADSGAKGVPPAFEFDEAVSSTSGSDSDSPQPVAAPVAGKRRTGVAAATLAGAQPQAPPLPEADDPHLTADGLHRVCCVCGNHSGEVFVLCLLCVREFVFFSRRRCLL